MYHCMCRVLKLALRTNDDYWNVVSFKAEAKEEGKKEYVRKVFNSGY